MFNVLHWCMVCPDNDSDAMNISVEELQHPYDCGCFQFRCHLVFCLFVELPGCISYNTFALFMLVWQHGFQPNVRRVAVHGKTVVIMRALNTGVLFNASFMPLKVL